MNEVVALFALGGSTIALTTFVIVQGIWLHGAGKTQTHLRDVLDASQTDAADFESRWRVETTAHAVTTKQLEQERTLRAIAEAQRNEAMRRVRELLRKHMETATDDEIRELTADAFTSPLAIVPRPDRSDGVPRALPEAATTTDTDLLSPWPALPTANDPK